MSVDFRLPMIIRAWRIPLPGFAIVIRTINTGNCRQPYFYTTFSSSHMPRKCLDRIDRPDVLPTVRSVSVRPPGKRPPTAVEFLSIHLGPRSSSIFCAEQNAPADVTTYAARIKFGGQPAFRPDPCDICPVLQPNR